MTKEDTSTDLSKLTRTKLVQEAANYPDIVGAHGMKKDELLAAIYAEKKKLGEAVPEEAVKKPARAPKKKKTHDKAALKAQLVELKLKRLEAVEAKDYTALKRIRARRKKVKRTIRREFPASAAKAAS